MKTLNRTVMILRPNHPWLKWAAECFGETIEDVLEQMSGDENAYLLPDTPDGDVDDAFLRKMHKRLFEEELEGWCTDKKKWPKSRAYPVFREWFELELHTLVFDLGQEPLRLEEEG